MGNRVEFVTTYLGMLRAGLVAVPVNPRSATGELVRMVADCGARVVVADGDAVTTVRQAVAGLQDALVGADEELVRSTVVPRIVVAGIPAVPGETTYAALLDAAGTEAPVVARPRAAGGAPLHQRHVGPPARRDAQPPGAARQHRAGRRGRAADDRAATTWCSGCCRCSTSTASTPCSARCCASGPGWCWSTASTSEGSLEVIEDEAVTRRAGGAAGVRATGRRSSDLAERLGRRPAGAVGVGAAVRGAGRTSSRGAPGSPSTRATA